MTLWRKRQIRKSQDRANDASDDAWETGIAIMAAIGGVFLLLTIVALIII